MQLCRTKSLRQLVGREEKGMRDLQPRCLLKISSSGVIMIMSGVDSVLTTPECTCRRTRSKAAPTLTAPIIKPQIDRCITINKYVMVVLTVLEYFVGDVICRHCFFLHDLEQVRLIPTMHYRCCITTSEARVKQAHAFGG